MDTKKGETTKPLPDEALDAVSGGIKNDPQTTQTKLIELNNEISATKGLGDKAEFFPP
jgi:hypothetical protein